MSEHSDSEQGVGGSPNLTLQMAQLLANAGYLVFPCRAFSKAPATKHGLLDASTEPTALTSWFADAPDLNLAVACGPQPNGINLFALDIDPKNGGSATWKTLTDRHGVPLAPRHSTPSGGFHLFFDAPAGLRSSRNRLGPGIDHRAAGGYVVVPPSRLLNGDGEIIRYRASRPEALALNAPPALPLWVIEGIEPDVAGGVRLPSGPPGDETIMDWFREAWPYLDELVADGWEMARRQGDQVFLSRPGKDVRDGHSAVLHLDTNHLVNWSTTVDLEPLRVQQLNTDGSTSWSPWDYFVRVRCGGDYRAATKRAMTMAGWEGPAAGSRTGPSHDDATSGGSFPPMNLPTGFWNERPILGHIRDAAWSAGCSPDALLVQALARTATFVHPCFKLPGVEQGLIGKQQTLDFLGCVVAETSGGKTLAAGVGEMLVPAPDPPADGSEPLIDFEQRVGSGEGIAEFFLVPEMREDEDGKLKATGRRVIGKQALFMNVDEGTGFTNQAGRKGSTIVSTLASAWSGESLGQLNAGAETKRLVRSGRVRVCAVINMQDTNGYKLYSDELETVGFTGRLLFASAHDPDAPAPADAPNWPGPLHFQVRGGNAVTSVFFTYADEITSEIKDTRHGILTKRVQIERRQSQYLLLRCKVAALLAYWDNRLDVSASDWLLATSIVTMSATVLDHLDGVHGHQIVETAVTSAVTKLEVAAKADDIVTRRLKIGWKAKIVARLAKGPLPWKGLKDIVESGPRRVHLRDALDELVREGLVILDGSTYSSAS